MISYYIIFAVFMGYMYIRYKYKSSVKLSEHMFMYNSKLKFVFLSNTLYS